MMLRGMHVSAETLYHPLVGHSRVSAETRVQARLLSRDNMAGGSLTGLKVPWHFYMDPITVRASWKIEWIQRDAFRY